MALFDYQRLVRRYARDDTGHLSVEDIDDAIDLARVRYSKDRPRQIVEDLTGDGGQSLAVPADWVLGFSQPLMVEYPLGEVPPVYLAPPAQTYQTPDGEAILVAEPIGDGDLVRLTYSVFHALDESADTLPLGDREAVACYAAAALLDQLATQAAGDGAPTIQADSFDRQSKAREYAGRAKALRQRYYDELGIQPERNAAAGAVVDWDSTDSRGYARLTHDRRYR